MLNRSATATILGLGFACLLQSPSAAAQGVTVECHSVKYQYGECRAPLRAPQLVHQISSSPCIVNRSWGFNRKTGYIWVADGCAGVFADGGSYHYGQSGGYDSGARHYDDRGHDVGAMMAGALFGAAIGASVSHDSHKHTYSNYNYTSNSYTNSNYDGPHGIGALVDNPDRDPPPSQEVDPTVQKFDKEGNPNYDTDGNYVGGHGLGTLVDSPEEGGGGDEASTDNEDSPSD